MKAAEPVAPSSSQLRALLKRWQDSLELHTRYLALDSDRYQHVQPWPKHERPARWIVELARDKVRALSRLVDQRSKAGDQAFLDALELMGFLSTLVGLASVERFVPLCDVANERRDVLNASPPTEELTREMPRLAAKAARPVAAAKTAAGTVKSTATARPTLPTTSASTRSAPAPGVEAAVVEDAVRLLGWGRMWHELPEIIVRLADRPSLTQLRRILREQRPLIERRHVAASR